jgi:phage protein D
MPAPVFTPVFRVLADDRDITGKIADRLVSLTVTDEAGSTSDTVRIMLDDRDQVFGIPPTGAQLTVGLGYKETGGPVDMGVYIVDELTFEGPDRRFSISAKAGDSFDRTAPGRLKAPKSRSWHDTTLGAIVQTVAGEHGLSGVVSGALAAVKVRHEDQTEESDIGFLRRLATAAGAVVKPASGRLLFVPEGEAKTASGRAMPAVTLRAGDCTRWSIKIATRGTAKSVTAQWQDHDGAELRTVKVGSGEPQHTLRHTYPTEDAAKRAADAALVRAQRGALTLDAEAPGNPDLVAEASLTTPDLRSGLGGAWVISRATHTLTTTTYTTSITAEPPGQADDDDTDS